MATPAKSSAADRRRPTWWDALIVLCMAALAIAMIIFLSPRQTGDKLTAVVTSGGSTIAVLPLYSPNAANESTFYTIEDIPYPLVLEYRIEAIRVADADCPGKDCQHVGWIDEAGQQIICLPNRLIISLVGEGASSFDAVTG